MRWKVAVAAVLMPILASAAPHGDERPRGVSAQSDGTSAASVTIVLSARVVGTSSIGVRGYRNTDVAQGPRGTGFIRLGKVDSEGRRPETGRAIERRDDQGAFYVADVRARTRFSGGVRGELHVSGGREVAGDVDFRWVCGNLPESVYRFASSADAPGTHDLGSAEGACSHPGNEVPVQLVMHVPDGAQPGDVAGTYVFTAAPELM